MRAPITVVRPDLSAAPSASPSALLGLDHRRVAAEGVPQLLPVDAAELHAVQRDALDLLLDADEADLLVVEHDDDDGQLLGLRRLQLGHRHQEAAVAGEGDDGPVGMREPRAHRARHRVAHGAQAVGAQELARPVGLPLLHDQQAARPGIAGGDRVARQHGARDLHRPLRRQPRARRVERLVHLLAEGLGGLLAPVAARRRPFGQCRPGWSSGRPRPRDRRAPARRGSASPTGPARAACRARAWAAARRRRGPP